MSYVPKNPSFGGEGNGADRSAMRNPYKSDGNSTVTSQAVEEMIARHRSQDVYHPPKSALSRQGIPEESIWQSHPSRAQKIVYAHTSKSQRAGGAIPAEVPAAATAQEGPSIVKPKVVAASEAIRLPTSVKVDLHVALRIGRHCQENTSTTGELIGLEMPEGELEVTDCFSTDLHKDLWVSTAARNRSVETEQKKAKELERYSTKMHDFLARLNGDCLTLGWYEATRNFSFLNADVTEKLMMQYDRSHGHAVVLCFDLDRSERGQFPLRAFTLSEEFLKKRKNRHAPSARTETLSIASRAIQTNAIAEILLELPVTMKYSVLLEALVANLGVNIAPRATLADPMDALYMEVPGLAAKDSFGCSALPLETLSDIQPLTTRAADVFGNSDLESGLTYVTQALDTLADDTEKLLKFQKDAARIQQSLKRTMEMKRIENEQKRIAGEEPVYVDEETLLAQLEKKLEVPSLLKTRMMMQQVNNVVQALSLAAKENVTVLQHS